MIKENDLEVIMLPQNERRVCAHAEASQSDPALLEEFRTNNPQLVPVEWDGRGTFCDQFWHIVFLNHREYSRGMPPECCYDSPLTSCITDHKELWQDRETEDLVHVAHPYCRETDKGFREGVSFLEKRGLNCAMSESSWYVPGRSTLVVVARPRTLERITLPELLYLHDPNEEWDTERIVAMQKAGEQIDVDRWFAEAQAAEARGDYDRATLLYVDTAHTERTGRFHRQAVRCLREAARLLRDHYNQAVLNVAMRAFLTHAEVRMIFRFAGIEVPDWLERIWRNGRRPDTWGFRMERNEDGTGWTEFRRCVVCEEWMTEDERVYDLNLGPMHRDRECLAKVAGVSPIPSR